MKRLDLAVATALAGLAAFVGAQAFVTRQAHAERSHNGEPVVSEGSNAVASAPTRRAVRRSADDDPNAEDVRRRIELASPNTYIGEVLASHDSALARWPERRTDPLRVWIQPVARIRNWSPTSLQLVRDAFLEWGETGVPINFTFVLDSASANVHVTWVDRFREPISGKTLWTHDERWYILEANVTIAVHHQGGDALDRAATRAIALHEVGHLLGLDHASDSTSIMAPRVRVKELSPADRATVQLLYSLPPGRVGKRRA
ncbi:MAG: matrixin family metalloprotease [Gemmatimonadaceae bacterium]|nr:matrixin family metalloprotease [Gemmatimonadaceae bacterium]